VIRDEERLRFALRDRLAPMPIRHIERDLGAHRLSVELDPVCFTCKPGLVKLEPFTPPHWPPPPYHLFPIWPKRHRVFDFSAPIDESAMVQSVTLESKRWVMNVELEVMVDRQLRFDDFDWGGKWKRHPPSKRKRMRSWLRATDHEKLRFAPLRGRFDEVPRWAQHPGRHRLERLGHVVVSQELHVFAQHSADAELEALLEEHSRDWVDRVARAAWPG